MITSGVSEQGSEKKTIKIPLNMLLKFYFFKILFLEPEWEINEGYGDISTCEDWREAEERSNARKYPSIPDIVVRIQS